MFQWGGWGVGGGVLFDYKPVFFGGNLGGRELSGSRSADGCVASALQRNHERRYFMSNSARQTQQLPFVGVTTAFVCAPLRLNSSDKWKWEGARRQAADACVMLGLSLPDLKGTDAVAPTRIFHF